MGNRANVIFVNENETSISPCVYLHWNGGPESIYGFLNEMERRNVRRDQNYECARFIGIVTDFFDQDGLGSTSVGVVSYPGNKIDIETLNKVPTDPGDNGFYIICRTKDGVKMRRFLEVYENDTFLFKEMTEEEVELEKKTALNDEYIKSFEETFKKLQGDRGIDKF